MSSGSGNISNVVTFGGGAITSTTANGVCPQITVPLSNLSSMVTLNAGNSSAGANDFYGFYSASSPTSQAQYQVPSGKTLYVLGSYIACGDGNSDFQLGYGTAAIASEGTGTPPTGVIYYSANSTTTTAPFLATVGTPNYTYFPVGMSFPASSYPFFKCNNAAAAYMIMIGIVQ